MCGRFTLTSPPAAVKAHFGYTENPNFPKRHNIAPTQPVAIVRASPIDGAPQFVLVRWGLIPTWVKDIRDFPLIINARAEEAAEKASFRNAIRRRRCLIPTDGFYEWQAPTGKTGRKLPFHIQVKGGGLFAFAGLWEHYADADGNEIDTAAILTTSANDDLKHLHHRCPVIVPPADYDRWLDHGSDQVAPIVDLLKPAPNGTFTAHAVSTRVNNVANDDESLIAPLEGVAVAPMHMDDDAEAPPRSEQLDLF